MLVAIAIPIFTNQLEKSREATDAANVRSAIATLATKYLTENTAATTTVKAQQKLDNWQTDPAPVINQMVNGTMSAITFNASTTSYTVEIDANGNITVS